jgi:hypothetical protein
MLLQGRRRGRIPRGRWLALAGDGRRMALGRHRALDTGTLVRAAE